MVLANPIYTLYKSWVVAGPMSCVLLPACYLYAQMWRHCGRSVGHGM